MAPRPVSTPTPSPQRGQLIRLGVFLAVFGLITGLVLHELRRGQPTRSPVASFPAVLPGQAEKTPDAPGPVTPVVPRPEPSGAASVVVPTSPAPAARGEQGPGLTTPGASEAASPPGRHRVPHHAKKEEGLRAQARWCYRRQPWQTPGCGSKLMGISAIPCFWPLARVQWEASERFRLTVGNVRGIRLALNGQEIPMQSGRSNVKRDMLLTRALYTESVCIKKDDIDGAY